MPYRLAIAHCLATKCIIHYRKEKVNTFFEFFLFFFKKLTFVDYSEPCGISGKDMNHACMNEWHFLKFHMARSHIEMQRSGIEMGL